MSQDGQNEGTQAFEKTVNFGLSQVLILSPIIITLKTDILLILVYAALTESGLSMKEVMTMSLRSFPLWVAILATTGVYAGTIPSNNDLWTEYLDASTAQADGWMQECAISQQVTVSNDCCVGESSVGCRSTRAYWCDEFGLEKSVPLDGAVGFSFWHKAAWAGWNFSARIYMQPNPEEVADGVTEKRLVFNFPSSTSWIHNNFDLADGLWEWRVNNMWQSYGFTPELGDLVSIQWYFCSYFGVSIGDEMLIDGLCFLTEESAAPELLGPFVDLKPIPNPFNPSTQITFHLQESRHLRLAIYSLNGRLVKVLAEGVMESGDHGLFWNGRNHRGENVPSGVYLVVLESDSGRESKKLLLAR